MDLIVAVDRNWAIGKENRLLFSLHADLRHFKEMTMGAAVVMGDRTLLSLPGSRPLPGRSNIVMTLDPGFRPEGVAVCGSVEELAALLKKERYPRVFVMGGATIYRLLLPFCERAYITQVDAAVPDADAFFENLDRLAGWQQESCSDEQTENGLSFRYTVYCNSAAKPL